MKQYLEIVDVRANYERGILVSVQGSDTFNVLRTPFTFNRQAKVSVYKDRFFMGQITLAPLPQGESFPRIAENSRIPARYEPPPASPPPGLQVKTHPAAFAPAPGAGQHSADTSNVPLVQPRLVSVTLRFKGKTHTVAAGKRITVPSGTAVEILEATLKGGGKAGNLHLTLGGHAIAPTLPQTYIMRDIALNLRVFYGNTQAGRIVWAP